MGLTGPPKKAEAELSPIPQCRSRQHTQDISASLFELSVEELQPWICIQADAVHVGAGTGQWG